MGYPTDAAPSGYTAGQIEPATGSLVFNGKTNNKTFTVKVNWYKILKMRNVIEMKKWELKEWKMRIIYKNEWELEKIQAIADKNIRKYGLL